MKTKTKRLIVISVIAFITILNLAALGTQLYHAYFKPRISNTVERVRQHRNRQFDGFHQRLVETLMLTPEQADSFRQITHETMEESKPHIIALNQLRRELLQELSAEDPDKEKVNKLAEEIGNVHASLKKISAAHYLRLREICSPEQCRELLQIYDKMIPQGAPERGRKFHNRRGEQERGRHFENSTDDHDRGRPMHYHCQ